MQNIAPSKTLNRRARFYALMGILMALGGAINLVLAVLFVVLPILGETLTVPLTICIGGLGILMLPVGFFMILRGFGLKKDNELAYQVGESMRAFLGSDARYTFIRNISKRGFGYMDAVLVGPPGALVFRVVDFHGEWLNERAEWRTRNKRGNLVVAPSNPTRECARDVYTLRKLLAKKGMNKVPVYGVVVFTNENLTLKADGPVVPIAEVPTMYKILNRDYLKEERINSPQIRRTIDIIID